MNFIFPYNYWEDTVIPTDEVIFFGVSRSLWELLRRTIHSQCTSCPCRLACLSWTDNLWRYGTWMTIVAPSAHQLHSIKMYLDILW